MNLLSSARSKLLLASALLAGLAFTARLQSLSAGLAARWLLALAALGGAAWWWKRHTQLLPRSMEMPRLEVLARTGLSQRCGVALVRAEGRTYLVAHGDGFAEIRETPGVLPSQGRKARVHRVRATGVGGTR
jgi:flagellar protein FliO/FliZ